MVDSQNQRQDYRAFRGSPRVLGLTFSRCVGAALEELRLLPGVDQIEVKVVPFGVSLAMILPVDGPTAEQVRAGLRRAGFRVVSGRRTRSHQAHKQAVSLQTSQA